VNGQHLVNYNVNHLPQDQLSRFVRRSFQNALLVLLKIPLNITDSVTKFTEEGMSLVKTLDQFEDVTTGDEARDIASDVQVAEDSRDNEAGEDNYVYIY